MYPWQLHPPCSLQEVDKGKAAVDQQEQEGQQAGVLLPACCLLAAACTLLAYTL